jgi:hypothetical protein
MEIQKGNHRGYLDASTKQIWPTSPTADVEVWNGGVRHLGEAQQIQVSLHESTCCNTHIFIKE